MSKIVIIGAGAMGSIYASFLSKNNNEVLVIDIWKEHLKAIKKFGITSHHRKTFSPISKLK